MFLDGDEWRKFFDGFEREAFRFETQPKYTMPNEGASLARFLRGEPKPHDHNSRWHERVRAELDVVHLNYRPDGTQINREAAEGDLEPYRLWKHLALDAAIPVETLRALRKRAGLTGDRLVWR